MSSRVCRCEEGVLPDNTCTAPLALARQGKYAFGAVQASNPHA
jgi:hypothetical protein